MRLMIRQLVGGKFIAYIDGAEDYYAEGSTREEAIARLKIMLIEFIEAL